MPRSPAASCCLVVAWSILACGGGRVVTSTKPGIPVEFLIRNSSSLLLFVSNQRQRQQQRREQRQPPLLHQQHRFTGTTTSRSSSMWMKKLHSPSAERNKEFIWNVLNEHVVPRLLQQQRNNNNQNNNDNKDTGCDTTTTTKTTSTTLQILEVAAGSGVHAAYLVSKLAAALEEEASSSDNNNNNNNNNNNIPEFYWQSSDPELEARESQKAYIQEDLNSNIQHYVSPEPLCLTLASHGIVEAETESMIARCCPLDLIINVNMIHISPWEATVGLFQLASQKLKPGAGILYLYGPYLVQGTAVPSNLKFDQLLKAKDPRFGLRNLEDVIALAEQHGMEFLATVSMPANNLSVIFQRKMKETK